MTWSVVFVEGVVGVVGSVDVEVEVVGVVAMFIVIGAVAVSLLLLLAVVFVCFGVTACSLSLKKVV